MGIVNVEKFCRRQLSNQLGIESLETINLDTIDFALDVGSHPTSSASTVLNYRKKVAFASTIRSSHELGVRMAVFGKLIKELILRGKPFRVTNVEKANSRGNGSTTRETANNRSCGLRRRSYTGFG